MLRDPGDFWTIVPEIGVGIQNNLIERMYNGFVHLSVCLAHAFVKFWGRNVRLKTQFRGNSRWRHVCDSHSEVERPSSRTKPIILFTLLSKLALCKIISRWRRAVCVTVPTIQQSVLVYVIPYRARTVIHPRFTFWVQTYLLLNNTKPIISTLCHFICTPQRQ